MNSSVGRLATAVGIAAIGIYLGIRLGVYSEKDDAPGGVVVAALLILGSAGLGLWIAFRGRKPSAHNG